MKRYYVSKIKRVFVPALNDYAYVHRFQESTSNINYVGGEIAVDPTTGIPTQKALLILVDTVDHTTLDADAEMVSMPDSTLDTKLSAIPNNIKNRAQNKLQQIGFTSTEVTTLWNSSTTVRDLLNALGRLNNPNFDALNFDTP